MGKRIVINDCILVAENRGGRCVSQIYKNSQELMEWSCSNGHLWKSSFSNIKAGRWCPVCAVNRRRLNIDDAIVIATARYGQCLSINYTNINSKLEWECKIGHKWRATLLNVKMGTWCPYCSGLVKMSIKDCNDLAALKGGKCLDAIYVNSATKMNWECSSLHRWAATFRDIKHSDSWCPFCAKKAIHTIKECQDLAKSKNGTCLSSEYINSRAPMVWRCELGHIWKSYFASLLLQNTWCPECASCKTQKGLKHILSGIIEETPIMDARPFSWLRHKLKLQIDVWFPESKLAIEYDGAQHFVPVRFGNISEERAVENLKQCQSRDALKTKLIAEHPEDIKYFVRFNYKEKITEEYVLNKLKLSGALL